MDKKERSIGYESRIKISQLSVNGLCRKGRFEFGYNTHAHALRKEENPRARRKIEEKNKAIEHEYESVCITYVYM